MRFPFIRAGGQSETLDFLERNRNSREAPTSDKTTIKPGRLSVNISQNHYAVGNPSDP